MTDTPPPMPPAPALPPPLPPSLVTADSPCRKCGYNLRGLHTDGHCPECGTVVGVSVLGDLLKFSEPGWLRTLVRGTGMILLGLYLTLGLSLLAGVAVGARLPFAMPLILMVGFTTGLLTWIGTWLLTTPDPSGVGEDKYGTVRKIVRVTLAINLGTAIFSNLPQLMVLSQPLHQLVTLLQIICGSAGVIGLWAQLSYLEKLADRLPDPKMVATARMLKIWMTIIGSVMFIVGAGMGAVMLYSHRTPASGWFIGIGCFAGLFGIVQLILYVYYLVMLHGFRRQLEQQATLAEVIWTLPPTKHPA